MFVKTLKTCLPKSENIYEKTILLNWNFFSRKKFFEPIEQKFYNRAKFFENPFFPKPESKKKYKKLPRKLSNSTKSLRTRRLIFDNTAKNFSKFSQKKIRINVRKKFNKIAFMKTVVFAQIISACVTCTFESPAKLCLQRSNKIQIRLRNQF